MQGRAVDAQIVKEVHNSVGTPNDDERGHEGRYCDEYDGGGSSRAMRAVCFHLCSVLGWFAFANINKFII